MLIKDLIKKQKNNHSTMLQYKGHSLTYNEFNYIVENKLERFSNIEVNSNNIGLFLPNSINYAIGYFTITFLDKVIVPIPIMAKENEIVSTVDYCELDYIITDSENKGTILECLKDNEYKVSVYNLDDNSIENIGKLERREFTNLSYSTENNDNVAIMLHTSGTTSNPKRVMLTHRNLISNIISNITSLGLTERDKSLIALPMFFGYCNTAQFLTHLYLGASVYILEDMFLPNKFFNLVQREKITNFTGVPSMLLMLLTYKNSSKYDTTSLRYICFGGGNMPVEKLRMLIDLFPHTGFVQTYGQTEASPRVTALLPEDALRKIGSVGKPIPNVQVRIVDEYDNDLNVGEIGEIIVKGYNVMKGYYKRTEVTNDTIRNGWLYTGDLAQYDNEGYIYLVGRKKNIIINGGINVYPEEVEELLLNHFAVKEALVYGVAHEIFGEVPAAKVVLNQELVKKPSPEELINYCLDKLANYKVPTEIIFVDKIEKTKTNKVKRYKED